MFLHLLMNDPQFYLFVVVAVVISITLHELAHGWAAMRLGDDTPIHTGHMTGNPLVHMGPFSLAALFLCGIAWGQMPIDPTRLRGRHGDCLVALAGPAANLLLAAVGLTALGLWFRSGTVGDSQIHANIAKFLFVLGATNGMLCLFNLMPAPPLDGSHVVASYHRGYALMMGDPSKQGIWIFAFIAVFMISNRLFAWVHGFALTYARLIAGYDFIP